MHTVLYSTPSKCILASDYAYSVGVNIALCLFIQPPSLPGLGACLIELNWMVSCSSCTHTHTQRLFALMCNHYVVLMSENLPSSYPPLAVSNYTSQYILTSHLVGRVCSILRTCCIPLDVTFANNLRDTCGTFGLLSHEHCMNYNILMCACLKQMRKDSDRFSSCFSARIFLESGWLTQHIGN